MTLPTSGPIGLYAIADEFGVARNTPFPSGFYGKGGAPSSGALSFTDFYGRSNVPAFNASATPNPVSGFGNTSPVTADCGIAVSGGVGPYTYSWTRVSGSTQISPSSSTSSSINFSAITGPGSSFTATYNWTATDTGQTPNKAVSGSVVVTLERS